MSLTVQGAGLKGVPDAVRRPMSESSECLSCLLRVAPVRCDALRFGQQGGRRARARGCA
jgi:hypothetical protein